MEPRSTRQAPLSRALGTHAGEARYSPCALARPEASFVETERRRRSTFRQYPSSSPHKFCRAPRRARSILICRWMIDQCRHLSNANIIRIAYYRTGRLGKKGTTSERFQAPRSGCLRNFAKEKTLLSHCEVQTHKYYVDNLRDTSGRPSIRRCSSCRSLLRGSALTWCRMTRH
jgi:hypothetical protein